MTELEKAAWDALALCERIIDGKRIWSLSDMREVSAPLRAALEKAEPVVEPVAWMVYTADGQSVYVTDNPSDIKPNQRALPLYTAAPRQVNAKTK